MAKSPKGKSGKIKSGKSKSPVGKSSKPKSGRRSGRSSPTKSRLMREEERARQEEEELRLKAEKEERERIAAQEKIQRDIEVNENLIALHEIQDPETQSEFAEIQSRLDEAKAETYCDPEWKRYTRCNRKPDPTSPAQINTFISLCKEANKCDIDTVLEESMIILTLIDELKSIMKDPDQETSEEAASTYHRTIDLLEELLLLRYNVGTMHVLTEATNEADPDTGNLQKVIKGENELIAFWANLNKNPRFKSFQFDTEKIQFEFPKQMAMADFAFRLLKTSFDPYSHHCSTYLPALTKSSSVIVITEVVASDINVEKSYDHCEGDVGLQIPLLPAVSLIASTVSKESNISRDSSSALKKPLTIPHGRKGNKTSKGSFIHMQEDRTGSQSAAESVGESDLPIMGIDITTEDSAIFDLRCSSRLGDIYHIDLLVLPPQPKTVNGWTIRKITDSALENFPFTSETATLRSATRLESIDGSVDINSSDDKSTLKLPVAATAAAVDPPTQSLISIRFEMPSDVLFHTHPEVGFWDKLLQCWRKDGVTDVICEEESNTLSFNLKEPGIIGLFQPTYLNMPYHSWELRPKAANSSVLEVTGAAISAEFEFKDALCCFNSSNEKVNAKLPHVLKKWLPVDELIVLMKKSGINFFPEVDAMSILKIEPKNVYLDSVYRQIAILSTGAAFSGSKWNELAPKHQLVVKATPFFVTGSEQDLDSVPDDDWDDFLVSDDRSYKLYFPYYAEDFEDTIYDNCTHQCDLLHAMRLTPIPGDDNGHYLRSVCERSHSVDPFYVNAVHSLMRAIDPITFTETQ